MFNNIVTYHILRSDDLPAYDAIGYQYITAGNGLFIRTETRFFTATVPVKRAIVRGLPLLKGRFHLRVPKLPESLLTASPVGDAFSPMPVSPAALMAA